MDPILITDFKLIVQKVILSNQAKLNPNYNVYIDSEEVENLLAHFGSKDISELLNNSSSSENNKAGLDEFESSKNNETTADEALDVEPEFVFKNSTVKADAKYDLEASVQNDLSNYNLDSPGGLAYQALNDQKKRANKAGHEAKSIEDMQENLEKLSENYTRNFESSQEQNTNKYNKSNEIILENGKKIRINQSVGLGADSAIANQDSSNVTDSDETDEETDTEEQNNDDIAKKISNGGVSYGLNISGEAFDTKLHINASFEDVDLKFGTTYAKSFNDKSHLITTVVGRETIIMNENSGSGGLAFDYKNADFSTGIYGLYEHRKEDDKQVWECESEVYAKYKENVSTSINFGNSNDFSYLTADVDLNGVKTLENKNLKLSGSLLLGGGFMNPKENLYDDTANSRIYAAYADAKGGLQFKAEDMSANVNGIVSYQCLMVPAPTNEYVATHNIGGAVLGNFTKDKFSISALVNVAKEDLSDKETPATVATNVTVAVKNVFKGITPFLSYTLDNSSLQTGLPHKHSISGGIKISLEDLSK